MNIEQETDQYLQSVADLEEMLEDECLCESKHGPNSSTPNCSIIATHRMLVTCYKASALVCESLALANLEFMEDSGNHLCIYCNLAASECWKVTLI